MKTYTHDYLFNASEYRPDNITIESVELWAKKQDEEEDTLRGHLIKKKPTLLERIKQFILE